MKEYKVIHFSIGFLLLILYTFYRIRLNLDYLPVLIYFILGIPVYANYLDSAKLLGNEFIFKKEIKEIENKIEKISIQEENNEKSLYQLFDLKMAKELLGKDNILSLASVRIEIEKVVREVYTKLNPKEDGKALPLISMLNWIHSNRKSSPLKVDTLKDIIDVCNRAIHGKYINYEETKKIIKLTEDLNFNVSVGYSINFKPNKDYFIDGYWCKFEHCIENMPIAVIDDSKECSLFGHECPGGSIEALSCNVNKKNQNK